MKTIIAFAVAAAFAAPALSQDKPKPPPAWHQGKPAAQAESKLAPHAGKMTETPASEIPIKQLKLPAGFKAEIWASGLPGARAMAVSEDGRSPPASPSKTARSMSSRSTRCCASTASPRAATSSRSI
jgi:glucose/arabinose dehydrogenase